MSLSERTAKALGWTRGDFGYWKSPDLAAAEKLAKAVEEVLEAESPYDRLRELRAALEHWREVSQ